MSSSIHGGQERVIQFLNLKVQAIVSPPWESAQESQVFLSIETFLKVPNCFAFLYYIIRE